MKEYDIVLGYSADLQTKLAFEKYTGETEKCKVASNKRKLIFLWICWGFEVFRKGNVSCAIFRKENKT